MRSEDADVVPALSLYHPMQFKDPFASKGGTCFLSKIISVSTSIVALSLSAIVSLTDPTFTLTFQAPWFDIFGHRLCKWD